MNCEYDDEKTFDDILKEKERELLYISLGEKAALARKRKMINKKYKQEVTYEGET
ncbi:hypothetical protein [Pseudogracilibacillus sp. SO30301A]|uniref:hypothetical protein n=1 Tax=Pseudogracilibacillus sp. SO30301A TaxID=3098291 RepID=UPI00300E6AE9